MSEVDLVVSIWCEHYLLENLKPIGGSETRCCAACAANIFASDCGTDCTGVIASDCITINSRVATWICWVQPCRLA